MRRTITLLLALAMLPALAACGEGKDTGIGGPLCGKTECRHDDKDCNAYLRYGSRCILVDKGRIYWIDSSVRYEADSLFTLNSVCLEGGGARVTCTVTEDN